MHVHGKYIGLCGAGISLLLIVFFLGCHFKTGEQRSQGEFDRQVNAIRAGSRDALLLYDLRNTDVLLRGVTGMRGIKQVAIENANDGLTDAGFRDLATFPDLEKVTFWHTEVTDAMLQALATSPTLTALDLTPNCPPDFQFASILKVPSLKQLRIDLSDAPSGDGDVTDEWVDAAFKELRDAASLERLRLVGQPFVNRKAIIADLQHRLPNCKIQLHASSGKDDGPPIPLE